MDSALRRASPHSRARRRFGLPMVVTARGGLHRISPVVGRPLISARAGHKNPASMSRGPGWLTRAIRFPSALGGPESRGGSADPESRSSGEGRLLRPALNLWGLLGLPARVRSARRGRRLGGKDRFAFEESARLHPLGRPSPLPAWTTSLVRHVVGPGRVVFMTSGANTKRALRAAHYKAAATRDAVHLDAPPQRSVDSIAVLAHELSHVADGVRDPRFFLGALLDEGERRARALESTVRSLAGMPGGVNAASVAQGLQALSGGTGSHAERARDVAGAAEALRGGQPEPGPAVAGLGSLASEGGLPVPAPPSAAGVPGHLGAAVPGIARTLDEISGGSIPGAAGSALSALGRTTGGTPLPLPELPNGPAGLAQVGRGVFGGAAPISPVGGLVPGGVASLPVGGLDGLLGAASNRVPNLLGAPLSAGAAGDASALGEGISGSIRQLIGGAPEAADTLAPEASGALDELPSASTPAVNTLGSLVGSASTAATDPFSQMTEFMEVLEERLLAELERRGGRFGGMF